MPRQLSGRWTGSRCFSELMHLQIAIPAVVSFGGQTLRMTLIESYTEVIREQAH